MGKARGTRANEVCYMCTCVCTSGGTCVCMCVYIWGTCVYMCVYIRMYGLGYMCVYVRVYSLGYMCMWAGHVHVYMCVTCVAMCCQGCIWTHRLDSNSSKVGETLIVTRSLSLGGHWVEL